jgi:catechol 2,3-dioxygenase-like lactoylglutathione lyase family enzyme
MKSDQVAEYLHACGVAVEVGPVAKAGALGPIMSVYCRDPDGNLIEVASYSG